MTGPVECEINAIQFNSVVLKVQNNSNIFLRNNNCNIILAFFKS
jgi:hypothetical protein